MREDIFPIYLGDIGETGDKENPETHVEKVYVF